jgi:transposase InsO family protein
MLRDAHPKWGARKLRARLLALGTVSVPSPSTITAVLKRHGRLSPEPDAAHRPFNRFEHDAPNCLWQIDFKGHFAIEDGRCHPLTVLDDHSRFAIGSLACADEQAKTVQDALTGLFRRYGLPERILCDNGPPWGHSETRYTALGVWLLRIGVGVAHGRPCHPQTQGKDERFHRTLNAEVIQGRLFHGLDGCQRHFDQWREVYNHQRPHEALGLEVPAQRYQPSERCFPEILPQWEYSPGDAVRKVQTDGSINFRGREYDVGQAFRGERVAVRPASQDGLFGVYFGVHQIAQLDFKPRDQDPC